jgi:gliding motility-associated lipoprotein GldB
MNKFIGGLVILLLVVSCKREITKQIDVSGIDVEVSIDRFEQKFYSTTEESLPELKSEYPFLFPVQNPDSVWLNRINNDDEIALFKEAQFVFEDFSTEKTQMENLFRHIKYYHSTFKEPKTLTLITDLDYQNKVMLAEGFLFISLDIYLGKENEIYKDFPVYLSQNFDKSQLQVDIAKAICEKYTIPTNNRQFIDLIVNEGKKMYQLDCYLPLISDAQKMGCSTEKMDWVEANETSVWKYFIENKLLYSTDADLYTRFVADAPYSKFYLDIDKESPGKIGVWLGWQIVRSYMNNNNVTLQQLLQTNAEEIFKKSKYKPKK